MSDQDIIYIFHPEMRGTLSWFLYSRKDERLSEDGWLIYSGQFTHISAQPSSAAEPHM